MLSHVDRQRQRDRWTVLGQFPKLTQYPMDAKLDIREIY